jgi:glycosyltransferase involved in cell wall biosynthesis
MKLRLGVDAFNLAADRRGMGRLVRRTLEQLRAEPETEIVLISRSSHGDSATPRDVRRLDLDAVWYPWNGMRFRPHARAIVTINDPFAFTYPHPEIVARWREQTPIRRAIRKADAIFTISEWGARELQRLFHVRDDRLRVVLPGADPFWHPVPAKFAVPYVLFVGGPDARKNAAMLFAAYDEAFAGGGPELIAAGTLGETDEARFATLRAPHRRVAPSDEELRELYSGAIAVAVPSTAEGFGLPVIEAMACGAPVLASDAAALPEAAGGAALLLPPSERQSWADALRRIAGDEQLRCDLRARGLERVKQLDAGGIARALLECVRRWREAAR